MNKQRGFTIVELLLVIVVIAILSAIVIVAYNGVQLRARQAKAQSDISNVQKLVETHKAFNGTYPVTAANLNPDWATTTARTDANCAGGTQTADWVPGLTSSLPQSDGTAMGVGDYPGCYIYASDGTNYVISAWNMFSDPVAESKMYRRLGFREMNPSHIGTIFYICNHSATGGVIGTYGIDNDYYRHSYTLSNFTSCNETPPSGA